jgi:hypothetical protein
MVHNIHCPKKMQMCRIFKNVSRPISEYTLYTYCMSWFYSKNNFLQWVGWGWGEGAYGKIYLTLYTYGILYCTYITYKTGVSLMSSVLQWRLENAQDTHLQSLLGLVWIVNNYKLTPVAKFLVPDRGGYSRLWHRVIPQSRTKNLATDPCSQSWSNRFYYI